jgi:hypothetical protein
MMQADAPPVSPPATEVVVARSDHTTVAASLDLPLTLMKAGRREEMVVRRVLFVNAAVTQVRPPDGSPDRYRWKLGSFLERQYCVRSLTGLFACTTPEAAALTDKADGEAPLAQAGDFRLAVQAEGLLSSTLAARSDDIFAADRQATVEPLLKAAGTVVAKAAPPRAAPRR